MTDLQIPPVADDEVLYRRVLDNLSEVQEDGTTKILAQAFTDRNFRVSVDRAKLCNNDPKRTLGSFSGGVIGLLAKDVRAIDSIVQYDKNQNTLQVFRVDVEPMPILNDPALPDNPAHAEISTIPACPNDRVFKRLRERLALLANASQWQLKPPNLQKK